MERREPWERGWMMRGKTRLSQGPKKILNLWNGKRAACNHGVMDARGKFAMHERSVRVARGDSRVRLKLLECLANLPSASITPWLHSCNVYHFFYNIIKGETLFSICLRLSHRSKFMYAAICPRVNKSCSMSKTCLWVFLSLNQPFSVFR